VADKEESALYPLSEYSLDSEAVAGMLGYTVHHVRRLAQFNKIPALKIGRDWFFHEQELMDHIQHITIDITEEAKERHIEREPDTGGPEIR